MKLTLPGSVYASRGKLIVKIPLPHSYHENGKRVYHIEHTKLPDNKKGWELARERHLVLYKQLYLNEQPFQENVLLRVQSAFEQFLNDKPTLHQKTKRNYTDAFTAIFGTVNTLLTDTAVQDAINSYLRSTRHQPVSIQSNVRCVFVFVNWCIGKDYLTSKAKRISKVPTAPDTVAGRFTPDEIPHFLKACYTIDTEFGVMNEFMMLTGARVVDVLTLTREQIQGTRIVWRNKITKQPEPRPVLQQAAELLDQLPVRDKIFRWEYISQSYLSKLFNKALTLANLPKHHDGRPRTLKSWRVVFRASLHNLPDAVQKYLMRHESLQTTQEHYTYYTIDEERKFMEKITP